MTIDIDDEGTVTCLWSEKLPLADLGKLKVQRASNVEFNHETQQWEVVLASEPERVAFSNPSRSVCIDWEIKTINEKLLTT